MKSLRCCILGLVVWIGAPMLAWSQDSTKMELIFPAREGWTGVREGEKLEFVLKASGGTDSNYTFSIPEGIPAGAQFDSSGHFSWTPGFDFVERLQENKTAQMLFEAKNSKGEATRQQVDIKVIQVNQSPVIGDLKNCYVQFNVQNNYQIDPGAVKDPDNDPLVFMAIAEQMPEGARLSAKGEFTWKPSLGQFNQLKSKPLTLEFIVEDQPGKVQAKGKFSIQATQMDLPPTITMVPNQDKVRINEDTPVSLEFYLEDPNGDDNLKTFDFVANDPRILRKALVQNTPTQYEFLWRPDYNFVHEAKDSATVAITFFVIDKTNKRDEQKITLTVLDTENEQEKERNLYGRYRMALVSAWELMEQLKAKEKELKSDLKTAKKGKKNRSIINASMGAVTGLSPALLNSNPTTQKVVSSVGGTTVLTMGTLEATNVIGKSQGELVDKLNKTIEKRNELQTRGDIFTRKYALSSARHNQAFPNDLQDFIALMNLNTTLELELDANWKSNKAASDSQISKTFRDFVPFNE